MSGRVFFALLALIAVLGTLTIVRIIERTHERMELRP